MSALHAMQACSNCQEGIMAETVQFLTPRFLSASKLIGAEVRNPQDESLGTLKDLMIDTASGKSAFGVLSFGGVLGLGNKLFAVPWDNFTVDGEREKLVLDIARDRLKDAPGFDSDHWPDFADPAFNERMSAHYASRNGDSRVIRSE
jgi:sporulation protein YlmC with PRC-barrel domain